MMLVTRTERRRRAADLIAAASIAAVFVLFAIGALLRFPLALVMFAGGTLYLFVSHQDIGLLVGQVMNAATVSDRLWSLADSLVSRFRGGMGHVTVLDGSARPRTAGEHHPRDLALRARPRRDPAAADGVPVDQALRAAAVRVSVSSCRHIERMLRSLCVAEFNHRRA